MAWGRRRGDAVSRLRFFWSAQAQLLKRLKVPYLHDPAARGAAAVQTGMLLDQKVRAAR